MEKIIKVELRLRSGRHYSSPCPSAVHLAECLKAHSLATGAALNCFAFQTLKTECCDPTSPANSLTVNMGSVCVCVWGGMGRKHAFHLQEDESNWWMRQLWKIGSPIWGLSKVWLIYLAGSDGRQGFPCFHSGQEGQARGDWREILCVFLTFLTPRLRGVKKKKGEQNRSWMRSEERLRTEWVWDVDKFVSDSSATKQRISQG